MAASLSVNVFDAAPGNSIVLAGSGLTGGAGAGVTLDSQGVTAQPDLAPATIDIPAAFDPGGQSVTLSIPDGVMSGTLTVTASDGTTATASLRAVSQYAQASEYIGEGEDTSTLATTTAQGVSELDVLMRRASGLIDALIGGSVRYLQRLERHKFHAQKYRPPQFFLWHAAARELPLVSVDQVTFVSAKNLVTVFNPDDMYINDDLGYIEILAYAIGNYALLGELQTIGYSANVVEIAYTSGFTVGQYPQALRDATIMTVTTFLNRRKRQQMGMGAFKSVLDKATVDTDQMTVPKDARLMLRPYVATILA